MRKKTNTEVATEEITAMDLQKEAPQKRATRKSTTSKSTASKSTTRSKTSATKKKNVTENTNDDAKTKNTARQETTVITEGSVQPSPTPSTAAPKQDSVIEPTNEDSPKEQPAQIASVPLAAVKIPSLPNIEIHDMVELVQASMRSIILTDQQIQQLDMTEIKTRHSFLQKTLANVLDYDVVISDTNIWLELLVGHTSSHSDPKYNARLQFERQLEFISKLSKYRGGKFMMMSETYEEIDRFACMQDPTNHRDADFTDNLVCLNAAARLAKRLILSQQRENRLRIDNIGAESHHASFADPAIIRRVVELFAAGKKVLLLTNDASVAIRSMGICDDLQRHNNIDDEEWTKNYVPLRPMVFTFDELRILDYYTRQYHYIQSASGEPWMGEVDKKMNRQPVNALTLWEDAFAAGDKHKTDNLFIEQEAKINVKQPRQTRQQKVQNAPEQPSSQGTVAENATDSNNASNKEVIVAPTKETPQKVQNKTSKVQKRKTQSRRKNTQQTKQESE